MTQPRLLEGLGWKRVAWTAALAAGVAAIVVRFFENTYPDLLVSALCVGFSIMLLVTIAGNLKMRWIPREARMALAVVLGSLVGTIITSIVKGRNPVMMLQHEDVLSFQAGDKYTRVVSRDGEAWIRTTIKELAASLDPARFWQVHRATLVDVREIARMERTGKDSGELSMKNHPARIDVSRGYLHLFRQM